MWRSRIGNRLPGGGGIVHAELGVQFTACVFTSGIRSVALAPLIWHHQRRVVTGSTLGTASPE